MLFLLSHIARADDASVALERGRVAMELGHHREALGIAEEVLGTQPDSDAAARLRYDALAAGRLTPSGPAPSVSGDEQRGKLAELVGAAVLDQKAIKTTATTIAKQHADHPEALGPLWAVDDAKVVS
ncbi:MAG: hypothetical protein KC621_32660, partial [Myxococcales bacterium]|nr:hypothetical protein [Myxococcales bacterium]